MAIIWLRYGRRCAGAIATTIALVSCGFPESVTDRSPDERVPVGNRQERGSAHGHPTLCEAGEKVYFACSIGRRQLAVCGSRSGARYRYGKPGRVELDVAGVTRASRGFSGGGETQFTVANAGYGYTVYDRTVRTSFGDDGRHDPNVASGLIVRRGGRTIASRSCDREAVLASDIAGAGGEGDFVEH